MTIVIDASSAFYPGGVARATRELLDALEQQETELSFRAVSRVFKPKIKSGLALSMEHTHFPLPRAAEPWLRRFSLIERVTNADLFHATDHFLPLHSGTPAVATIHDTLFLTKFNTEWESHHYFRKVVAPFAMDCELIFTCSDSSKQDICTHMEKSEEDVWVIPWGVNLELFSPKSSKSWAEGAVQDRVEFQGEYLLAVSCGTGRKNTPALLTAFKELVDEGYKGTLLVLWSPPESLRILFDHPSIRFLSRVNDKELAQLYQGATGVLFPSTYEGFGFPVLEAMAAGTPVLTSNCSSLPEVGGDVAYYCDPSNIPSIKEGISSLLDDRHGHQERIENGLERAKQYSWENCAKETIRAYEYCLRKRSAR